MKKAVFTFFLLLVASPLLTQAQENTGLLDPVYQLFWKLDGQIIKFDTPLLGISKDPSGITYVLFSNGEFKEISENNVKILEEADAKPFKIFQYQIGKRGKIAVLRTDGTIEINFEALSEEGTEDYTKTLNRQIAFSSEDSLWVLQEDASLYQWSKVEKQWRFIVQDESIRTILVMGDTLYAIRETTDGDKTSFAIYRNRNSFQGGGEDSHWMYLDFKSIFKDPNISLRTLGFDGTHLFILAEEDARPHSYHLFSVPFRAIE